MSNTSRASFLLYITLGQLVVAGVLSEMGKQVSTEPAEFLIVTAVVFFVVGLIEDVMDYVRHTVIVHFERGGEMVIRQVD